jgi:transcriptional regulator with XRE-family HTH domain
MPTQQTQRKPNSVDHFVGERIRTARLLANMSQEKLGDALGITFQQVQKYEKGSNRVASGRLQRIAEILQRPITYFYGEEPATRGEKNVLQKLGQTRGGIALATAFAAIKDKPMRDAIVATAEAAARKAA